MESKLAHMQSDKEKALTLLFHDKKTMNFTLLHGVQKFVMQEQRYKYSLLKDIDRLSRKLRGISSRCPTSGLFALRQSAVTGKPKPETIDYRFLSNHISLLEADAEHMQKKIGWKDAEIKSLQGEVVALRKRFNCPRDEDANQQFEAQCD
ncbi:uncharacterized protein LOC131932796 [Physella acuta]|uniref:uncharacterized protein LOC131932796 n=1 Tax=Physella acuta TaxID=109671 RepID=UPI0027DC0A4B|nr:uncharacterized protein LOC131932796 [Physella acuta]